MMTPVVKRRHNPHGFTENPKEAGTGVGTPDICDMPRDKLSKFKGYFAVNIL